ncbi:MAG TPA: prefoldin subunit alpha [Candidatus Nanoarchaeia archaeon]|nr:prefoldin subunit alpha [Candidatus Nanoarchaeia archaeon]
MGEGKTHELQERRMELHAHEQKLQQIQQYLAALEQQVAELRQTSEAIADIAKLKGETSSFVPVSSGIFVQAAVASPAEFLVNVGAHTAVKKSKDEVLALISSQVSDIQEMQQKLAETFLQIKAAAERIQMDIAHLSRE